MAHRHALLDRKRLIGTGIGLGIRIGFLVLLGLLHAAEGAARDGDWKLSQRGDEPGKRFELYQREVANSGYHRYRLEAVVDEPIERVVQAIQIRAVDDRYLGEGLTRSIFYGADGDDPLTYFKMRVPLIKDRDVALRTKRGFDAELRVYRDEWWTANEEAPPLTKGFVRMAKSEGFWEVMPAGEYSTHVVYESYADPGGRVPSWIANRMFGGQVIGQIVTLRRIIDDNRIDVASPPPSTVSINIQN